MREVKRNVFRFPLPVQVSMMLSIVRNIPVKGFHALSTRQPVNAPIKIAILAFFVLKAIASAKRGGITDKNP